MKIELQLNKKSSIVRFIKSHVAMANASLMQEVRPKHPEAATQCTGKSEAGLWPEGTGRISAPFATLYGLQVRI